MKKWVVLSVIVGSIVMSYYVMYPPLYIIDNNIPHPSCTELGNTKALTDEQKSRSRDIMTAVLLTNGKGYTNFTASVIREYHAIADEDISIFTVNAFKYTKSTLQAWYGENIKIFELESQAVVAKKILETFSQSKYKIMFLIDSEMVFLRNWIDFITEHMIRRSVSFLSLYHSATMHSFTNDCETSEDNLCKGDISAKFGIAMTKDIANVILKKYIDFRNFKYDWTAILKETNVQSLYPAKSIVMQIGRSKQEENYCGENEVPYGFKLCELPCWIRDGIEFYFDLCTNPQEMFSSKSSMLRATIEKRKWVRPVITYSFYGNKPRYVKGALENAKRIFTVYPGWKIWIYLDNSVANDVLHSLCSYNVKFVNMTGTTIRNQMSWRFLIAAEPVPWFTILDIDYRMLSRGKEATDEWLESGRLFHVMRDHPEHSWHAMNGQMWGGYGNSIPNIKELIVGYGGGNWFMMDIHFLTSEIWPIVKKSVWVHDTYPLHKFGEERPFPFEKHGDEFVGNVDFN